MRRPLVLLTASFAALGFAGCASSPYDPYTAIETPRDGVYTMRFVVHPMMADDSNEIVLAAQVRAGAVVAFTSVTRDVNTGAFLESSVLDGKGDLTITEYRTCKAGSVRPDHGRTLEAVAQDVFGYIGEVGPSGGTYNDGDSLYLATQRGGHLESRVVRVLDDATGQEIERRDGYRMQFTTIDQLPAAPGCRARHMPD